MRPQRRITSIAEESRLLLKEKLGNWDVLLIGAAIVIDAVVLWAAWQTFSTSGLHEDPLQGVLFMLFFPWIALGVVYGFLTQGVRDRFWKQYAAENGYTYTTFERVTNERGLMFREGNSRRAHNLLSGTHGGMPVRIFEYSFTVGRGKNSTSYTYTVFEFGFSGSFPHTYLNHTRDGYNIRPAGELHLPPSLGERFKLYAPEQYEIEVLQIFTPDVLAFIEDLGWTCDLELLDRELIVYRPGLINTRGQIDMEFAKAAALAARLRPTLERMTLAEIGTNKPILRSYTTKKEFDRT